MSRPALYREDYPEMAFRLSCPGLTDAQIAFSLDINERTLNRWKKQYPGFCQSLKAGKDFADAEVAHALYRKATGYTYQAEEIKKINGTLTSISVTRHQLPDTTACIFWLKNRKPALWRDRAAVPEKETIEVHHALQIAGAIQKPG